MKTPIKFLFIVGLLLGWTKNNELKAQFLIACNSDSVPIRIKPIQGSNPIIRISTGTQLKAIAQSQDYIKVVYKRDTGYILRSFVKGVGEIIQDNDIKGIERQAKLFEQLNNLPDDDPSKEFNKIIINYTDKTIDGAIRLYGKEDDRSQFESGEYDAITLVWHCAQGKYRSISYVFKAEGYVKESEYVSNCIK